MNCRDEADSTPATIVLACKGTVGDVLPAVQLALMFCWSDTAVDVDSTTSTTAEPSRSQSVTSSSSVVPWQLVILCHPDIVKPVQALIGCHDIVTWLPYGHSSEDVGRLRNDPAQRQHALESEFSHCLATCQQCRPSLVLFNLFTLEAWLIAKHLGILSTALSPFVPKAMPADVRDGIREAYPEFLERLQHSAEGCVSVKEFEFWMWRTMLDDLGECCLLHDVDPCPLVTSCQTPLHHHSEEEELLSQRSPLATAASLLQHRQQELDLVVPATECPGPAPEQCRSPGVATTASDCRECKEPSAKRARRDGDRDRHALGLPMPSTALLLLTSTSMLPANVTLPMSVHICGSLSQAFRNARAKKDGGSEEQSKMPDSVCGFLESCQRPPVLISFGAMERLEVLTVSEWKVFLTTMLSALHQLRYPLVVHTSPSSQLHAALSKILSPAPVTASTTFTTDCAVNPVARAATCLSRAATTADVSSTSTTTTAEYVTPKHCIVAIPGTCTAHPSSPLGHSEASNESDSSSTHLHVYVKCHKPSSCNTHVQDTKSPPYISPSFTANAAAHSLRNYFTNLALVVMDTIDHCALFPQCDVIIHHGGIGTTHMALESRRPQLIFPLLFDQGDNADHVQRLGAGVNCGHPTVLTVAKMKDYLQHAHTMTVDDVSREAALSITDTLSIISCARRVC